MFETRMQSFPRPIDEIEPGPMLAGLLATLDVRGLCGYDRIVVLRAHQRMASHYQAKLYEDMAAVSDAMDDLEEPELEFEAAAAEIRVALRLTRRASDSELAFALDLRQRLPRVWGLLASGEIDLRRAKTITYGTRHLPLAMARQVTNEILADAARWTTGQLAARIRKLCNDVDPDHARERYRQAVDERRLVAEPTESGIAHLLGLDLPPDRLAAATARINALARGLRTAAEGRTMDQLRADVFLDLLEGRSARTGNTRGACTFTSTSRPWRVSPNIPANWRGPDR